MARPSPPATPAVDSAAIRGDITARGPQKFTIVGIGSSAGGLDACRRLIEAVPPATGMAFILIQHLDPSHASMMVDLLAEHTKMIVIEATEGMTIEPDHFYVIPPGTYLSIQNGALHLSQPSVRHGAGLPFDFLLNSMAETFGPRAACVILSGTGADGTIGLRAIKDAGGIVIAQDPEEAAYGGMPQNAILTGAVDHVLAVAEIPATLVAYNLRAPARRNMTRTASAETTASLHRVVDLLRRVTAHDFTLYKEGTLRRRIERRMTLLTIEPENWAAYLDILKDDPAEAELLAKDLLINVTSFFRDPEVFARLGDTIITDLIERNPGDQPIRIWIAGCSTGEEAYSLLMLFTEAIAAARRVIKLQVFASDVDIDAVLVAREGLYPESIAAEVSPERLAQFFTKEGRFYRIQPEWRERVVFTVQDLLGDPPFSRLDFVSCRNLLIDLRPEAQAKVIALLHFALRENGYLLLGGSETISSEDRRFEVISKPERVFRRKSTGSRDDFDYMLRPSATGGVRVPMRPASERPQTRQDTLAELCRQLVMEHYAPAAVVINARQECLYFFGPTDRYLRVAPGLPTHDLLAMVRDDLRTRLRAAIQQVMHDGKPVVIGAGRTDQDARTRGFNVAVRPIARDDGKLLLVCFIDDLMDRPKQARPPGDGHAPEMFELEGELETTKAELRAAIRNLEVSGEDQKTINEEALSANEELQSTNEEMLASKEELQSLNEELTALNSQLQETLRRQRTLSNDLQNVLYSTDVATIFLDLDLNIRFFTPASRLLFNVIPSDVGRPLADLSSLAVDGALIADARVVLQTLLPVECEITAGSGAWYTRRILPYRTQDDGVEGVVITFVDVTERKQTADALKAAKAEADKANAAKSHFLAAASHDLRQPLQTMVLLQGLLGATVEGDRAKKLVARLDETLGAVSGMLNTLLDINQIETGSVAAEITTFSMNDLLTLLRDQFTYHAQAQGLTLTVIGCSLWVESDPRLLEQMIRNLLSNALKYTKHGSVLLGCRRRGDSLSIEVWDTGIGIAETELQAIFEEYRQLDNVARERSHGLGLGLSIVQRLGALLGHDVRVSSRPGKGSMFSIDVPLATGDAAPINGPVATVPRVHLAGPLDSILVVEDDPDVLELLATVLQFEGYEMIMASDGVAALELVADGVTRPGLILTDYNLPNGMTGLQVVAKIREMLNTPIPAVVLTGDISTSTFREVALQGCAQLNKPIRLNDLREVVERLFVRTPAIAAAHPTPEKRTSDAIIFVVDDNIHVREGIRSVLEQDGRTVSDFGSCEGFLEAYKPGREACLLVDAYLPGMSGLDLLKLLSTVDPHLPAIMITGNGDVTMAVGAMKAGARDFIEKPISRHDLLACIERALQQSRDSEKLAAWREDAAARIALLTPRQHEIMTMVLAGHPSKNIAADLNISQRTVENHRASIMHKTGAKSLPALARLALAAV
jgi:two-component system CheB/CheR fusion protein